jgi:DNA-binding CsgD family transcriptional regulator
MVTVTNNCNKADKAGINGAGILPSGTAGSCRLRDAAGAPLGSAIFSEPAWEAISLKLKLSARERQIVRAILDDEKDGAIAENLGISRHTVHGLIRRLYAKLNLSGRPRLILRLVREFHTLSGSHPDLPPICPAHQPRKCLLACRYSEEP